MLVHHKLLFWGILLLTIISIQVKAQKTNNQHIYLKNRSVIIGEITEIKPGEYIHVNVSDSFSIKIPHEQVKRISHLYNVAGGLINKKGLILTIETGPIFGRGSYYMPLSLNYSLQVIPGYRFSNFLSTGIGIGYDGLGHINSFPLFVSFSGDFLKNKITPIYKFDIGYGFVQDRQNLSHSTGGIYFSPAIGFKEYYRKVAWGINMGYRYQKSTTESTNWSGWQYTENRKNNRITIKASLYF
ncbi:MAG: hypothetical protein M3512_02575 [Bacteroidota bacterium]|nr:hypothetical protein [Bacteroidota bacterium]